MKDPVRLLDAGASEPERALLRAGAGEEPPEGGAARLAAALGLSLSASAVSATSAAARSSTAPPASAQLATQGATLAVKWLLLLGGTLALGVLGWSAYRALAHPAAETHAAPRALPAPAPARPAAEATPAAEAKPVADSRPTRTSQPAAASTRAAVVPRKLNAVQAGTDAHARSIAGEIAALDRAREQLAAGDARSALSAVERYRAAHPRGVLRQEAALLEIEAQWRAGERGQARELALRFRRNYPGSPHLDRIRALIDGDAP